MADYLLDTNVLSKFFFGDAHVRQFLGGIDAGINTIVYIELIQGSLKKKQRDLIKTHIARLTYFTLTSEIAQKAVELIDKYSSSRGLFLADSLIASTAIINGLTLVTYNRKDFDFIEGLSIISP